MKTTLTAILLLTTLTLTGCASSTTTTAPHSTATPSIQVDATSTNNFIAETAPKMRCLGDGEFVYTVDQISQIFPAPGNHLCIVTINVKNATDTKVNLQQFTATNNESQTVKASVGYHNEIAPGETGIIDFIYDVSTNPTNVTITNPDGTSYTANLN